MILNALLCTDSTISSSVSVQLQNTMLPYSRPGRMKEVYIVVKVFLSIKFFSFAKIFNFLPAFSLIVVMWSFQDRFVLNSTPRCLCLATVSSVVLLNERGSPMLARFLLRVAVSALLLSALNLTSQESAHLQICDRSSFNWLVVVAASSLIVTYKDVSSAKSLMLDLIFSVIFYFIYFLNIRLLRKKIKNLSTHITVTLGSKRLVPSVYMNL